MLSGLLAISDFWENSDGKNATKHLEIKGWGVQGPGGRLSLYPPFDLHISSRIFPSELSQHRKTNFWILDISSSQNRQFVTRNPSSRSKISNASVQKPKIRKNHFRKTYVQIQYFIFSMQIGGRSAPDPPRFLRRRNFAKILPVIPL